MKVGSPSDVIRYLNPVHEKREPGDGGGNSPGQQNEQRNSEKEKAPEVLEVSDEKVGQAIEAFGRDTQAQASGLSAELNGKGPGLRVVLKDGSGAVLRQFTGEEFLKLREAATQGRSGRLLDQKI
jgi:hypothetical protein